MSVHYVRDLPGKLHLSEPPLHDPLARRSREVLLDQRTFDAIGDYTRSTPTSPSAGRVYRRNLHWSGPPSNWFVYLVVDDPGGDGQLHVPYSAVVV